MTSVTTGSLPVLSLSSPPAATTNLVLPVLKVRFWTVLSFSLPPEASIFFWTMAFRERFSPAEDRLPRAIKRRTAAAVPANIDLFMFRSFSYKTRLIIAEEANQCQAQACEIKRLLYPARPRSSRTASGGFLSRCRRILWPARGRTEQTQVGDGVGVVPEQGHLPGRHPEGTTVLQNKMPQHKGPQADLHRIIQTPPGKINSSSRLPEPFDKSFDFPLELGLAVDPPRIVDESRRDGGGA